MALTLSSKNSRLACLSTSILLVTAATAFAQNRTPAPVQTATPTAVANTAYAIRAQRSGATQCIDRINQVTGFISGKQPNSGIMFFPPKLEQSNQKLLAASIEVQAGSTSTLVSTHFSAGKETNECSASYDAVTFFPQACEQVAKTNFSAFKITGQALNKNIAILDGGAYAKVFLMPAGSNGCVAIKKEMVY